MDIETLKQCQSASIARASVIERVKALKEDATGVGGMRYDNAPHERGEPLSRQQRYIEALEKLSAEYEQTAAEWAELSAEVERAVRQLPPTLGELIRLRYIDGKKWEDINDEMHISSTTSKRLHHSALKRLGIA